MVCYYYKFLRPSGAGGGSRELVPYNNKTPSSPSATPETSAPHPVAPARVCLNCSFIYFNFALNFIS